MSWIKSVIGFLYKKEVCHNCGNLIWEKPRTVASKLPNGKAVAVTLCKECHANRERLNPLAVEISLIRLWGYERAHEAGLLVEAYKTHCLA